MLPMALSAPYRNKSAYPLYYKGNRPICKAAPKLTLDFAGIINYNNKAEFPSSFDRRLGEVA